MRLSLSYVLLMQNSEIAMIEGDNSPFMCRGENQLLRVSCLHKTNFERRGNVKSISAYLFCQTGRKISLRWSLGGGMS